MNWKIRCWLLSVLLLSAAGGCGEPAEPPSPPEASQQPARPPASADAFRRTVVTPYLDREIPPGKNVLWCATFQMAWDEVKRMAGGSFRIVPGGTTTDKLARESVRPSDVPTEGVITAGGLVGDGVLEEIRRRLAEIQGGQPRSAILPGPGEYPPDAVVVYAYLVRSLRFRTPFSRLSPWAFRTRTAAEAAEDPASGDREVAFFGIDEFSPRSPREAAQARQVRVLWHRFLPDGEYGVAEEFIVELLTDRPDDRLILAKISPAQTLRATVDLAVARMRVPNSKKLTTDVPPELKLLDAAPKLADVSQIEAALNEVHKSISAYCCLLLDETIRIPCVRLDLVKQYAELLGQTIVDSVPKLNGKPIVQADQRVRFHLDEKGAQLESEAVGGFFGSLGMREFSFAQPFLIMLMRREASSPYLACWVANDELLVKAGKSPAGRPE